MPGSTKRDLITREKLTVRISINFYKLNINAAKVSKDDDHLLILNLRSSIRLNGSCALDSVRVDCYKFNLHTTIRLNRFST